MELVSYSIFPAVTLQIITLLLGKSWFCLRVLKRFHLEAKTLNIRTKTFRAAKLIKDCNIYEAECMESVQLIDKSAIKINDIAKWGEVIPVNPKPQQILYYWELYLIFNSLSMASLVDLFKQ